LLDGSQSSVSLGPILTVKILVLRIKFSESGLQYFSVLTFEKFIEAEAMH